VTEEEEEDEEEDEDEDEEAVPGPFAKKPSLQRHSVPMVMVSGSGQKGTQVDAPGCWSVVGPDFFPAEQLRHDASEPPSEN
jgi:hypothetical protein